MEIALYHSTLPQSGRKPGGVQVFVDRLGEALARRGHQVTAFTYAPPSGSRSYAIHQLRPRRTADSRVLREYVSPWLFNARPFGDRFDVAHLHGDDWFFLRRRLPTVRTFHGSALMESLTATSRARRIDQAIVFGLERVAARRADAVYGVGPESRVLHGADGLLPCGIDLPANDDGTRAPADQPTILFVGTWSGRKRGALLHRAFAEHVRPAFPDARLVMVSDRSDGGPGVLHLACPTDAELAVLYRQAWLFCLPSSYEGLGIPYLEAMAAGAPVLATPNPGADHVLGGGRFGAIREPDELGPALVALLGDPSRRDALAAAGRERAEDFAWERVIDAHERAYALAIERWQARRGRPR
jgi:phosphatidyl-myo-inositol alpha-mannosyltransferase